MWLFKHFGEDWQNISLAADSDGDGRPNLAEYAFGSDPVVADSPMLPSVVNAGGYLVLTFSRNIANTDLTYIVQGSNNLTAWTDLASCTGSAATGGLVGGVAVEESGVGEFITVQVTDFAPAGGPTATRFLRVRLVK